jgi:hypothetical protein
LTPQDTITFSIDGTPENFNQYRVNGDWPSIKIAIDECVQSPVHTVWKYIPFAYNQHDIASVEILSKELGIDEFEISPSDRFDQQTDHLKPDDTLLSLRYNQQVSWKNSQVTKVIPACSNNQHHFITADGFYSPCCFLADHRFYYKTQFGKNKSGYDISKTTLSEILQQPATIDFYQNLQDQSGCQYNCPG